MNQRPPTRRSLAGFVPALLAMLTAGGLILAGCSTPEKKQKWLTFFFDGVPGTGATNVSNIQYDEDGRPLEIGTASVVPPNPEDVEAAAMPTSFKFFAHPPYEEKSCNECHISRVAVRLKGPEKQVCFACHDDFLAGAKFKHQPVEDECSACHDPHGSSHPHMLQ